MMLIGGMPVRLDLLKLFVCWKMPTFAEWGYARPNFFPYTINNIQKL